jgi:hypothetical protein
VEGRGTGAEQSNHADLTDCSIFILLLRTSDYITFPRKYDRLASCPYATHRAIIIILLIQ